MDYRLSPSDLTFLYEGCKRCFVLKVKHGITQPSIPLPGVFSQIASLQKTHYSGKRTEDFCPDLPPGKVTLGEERVRSVPIQLPEQESTCTLAGRFDILIEFDDRSYGIIDFKTGNPKEEKAELYSRQLHAYAYALEHPGENALALSPVTRLGLLFFSPDACRNMGSSRQVLEGRMSWIPIQRNDQAFLNFLDQVVQTLDGPLPEPDTDRCVWCQYRSRITGAGAESRGDPGEEPTMPKCPVCGGPMRKRSGKFGTFWGCLNYPECRGTKPA
jgi:hypothetical protein